MSPRQLRDDSEPPTVVGFDEGLSQFRQVVSEAKAVSSSWGSNLYFVYLPGWQSVSTQQPFEHRQEVLAIVEENGIRAIDLYDKFVSHHDSASLFPLRMENHYNADGYRLVADTILEALE